MSSMKKESEIRWNVLLSGGIDSALVVALLRSEKKDVEATWVDYGQPAAKAELNASKKVAEHYSIPWTRASISKISAVGGEVLGRNDLLVALARLRDPSRAVAIGIHAGSPYADCSIGWVNAWNSLLDIQTQGTAVLFAPLMSMEKAEILDLAQELDVPTTSTYSCEVSNTPCLKCLSCLDRKSLDAGAK